MIIDVCSYQQWAFSIQSIKVRTGEQREGIPPYNPTLFLRRKSPIMPRFSVSGTFVFLLLLPLLPLLWIGEWDGPSGLLLSSVEVLVSVFKSCDVAFFWEEKLFFGVTVFLGVTGLLGETILFGGVPGGDGFW
jgi:hypothetical protein